MEEKFISIRQGNILIANKIKTFANEKFEEIAEEIKIDIANNWRIPPDSCSWAIYERMESIYPEKCSENWNRQKI